MKRYIQFLSVVAAAGMLVASCAKVAPSKAEVEAGFTAATALPTLAISASVECDAVNGVITVPVTVSDLPADMTGLSIGVMTCKDENFGSSKFVATEVAANGTFSMQGAVTANAKYYVKAVAVSPTGGATYSDVITVEVPDIPVAYKALGSYTATFESEAYGDEYTNTIHVMAYEDDPLHYVWIAGIEPYYAEKYPGTDLDFNYVRASVDEKSGCLVVAVGEDVHLGGRSLYGLNATNMEDATKYTTITFKYMDSGNLYRYEAFQTVKSDGSAEDSYFGDVTYTVN